MPNPAQAPSLVSRCTDSIAQETRTALDAVLAAEHPGQRQNNRDALPLDKLVSATGRKLVAAVEAILHEVDDEVASQALSAIPAVLFDDSRNPSPAHALFVKYIVGPGKFPDAAAEATAEALVRFSLTAFMEEYFDEGYTYLRTALAQGKSAEHTAQICRNLVQQVLDGSPRDLHTVRKVLEVLAFNDVEVIRKAYYAAIDCASVHRSALRNVREYLESGQPPSQVLEFVQTLGGPARLRCPELLEAANERLTVEVGGIRSESGDKVAVACQNVLSLCGFFDWSAGNVFEPARANLLRLGTMLSGALGDWWVLLRMGNDSGGVGRLTGKLLKTTCALAGVRLEILYNRDIRAGVATLVDGAPHDLPLGSATFELIRNTFLPGDPAIDAAIRKRIRLEVRRGLVPGFGDEKSREVANAAVLAFPAARTGSEIARSMEKNLPPKARISTAAFAERIEERAEYFSNIASALRMVTRWNAVERQESFSPLAKDFRSLRRLIESEGPRYHRQTVDDYKFGKLDKIDKGHMPALTFLLRRAAAEAPFSRVRYGDWLQLCDRLERAAAERYRAAPGDDFAAERLVREGIFFERFGRSGAALLCYQNAQARGIASGEPMSDATREANERSVRLLLKAGRSDEAARSMAAVTGCEPLYRDLPRWKRVRDRFLTVEIAIGIDVTRDHGPFHPPRLVPLADDVSASYAEADRAYRELDDGERLEFEKKAFLYRDARILLGTMYAPSSDERQGFVRLAVERLERWAISLRTDGEEVKRFVESLCWLHHYSQAMTYCGYHGEALTISTGAVGLYETLPNRSTWDPIDQERFLDALFELAVVQARMYHVTNPDRDDLVKAAFERARLFATELGEELDVWRCEEALIEKKQWVWAAARGEK